MKKKIAIVVCAWPPQGGGMGSNAYYQAKRLSSIGYETTVFLPLAKKLDTDSSFILSPEKMYLRFGKAGFLFSLFKKLKSFDLVHLYYPFFGTDLIVWWFKKMNPRVKLVLHYQMDPVGTGWQRIFFWCYFKLFFDLMVKTSDKIIILSYDHGKNSYLKKYLKLYPQKFAAIPNGVDTNVFYPHPKNIRLMAQYGLTEENRVIIFVGGLDKQHYFKGVDILLLTLKQILLSPCGKGVKLIIVGDGDLKNHYQKMSIDLSVGDRVIFTDWVKNENLPDYYALADVFVLPSTARTESFGIVTAEAQACGLPALVSNWPGSRQTIEDNQTGFLIKPGDVNDLKEKLEKLLGDDNLRNKTRERGTARAGAMYSWDKVVGEIDKLYQGLLNPKSKITNSK